MSFKKIEHELVGKRKMYMPNGYSPYKQAAIRDRDPKTIVSPGDPVTVESAWTRPYLKGEKPLFYVRSHITGQATHVVSSDLK